MVMTIKKLALRLNVPEEQIRKDVFEGRYKSFIGRNGQILVIVPEDRKVNLFSRESFKSFFRDIIK